MERKIMDYLEKKGIDYDYYSGISETGYEDKPLLCSNWNKLSDKFYSFTEKHINLGWDDEWMHCDCCYKAVRSIPNSYDWEKSYILVNDCEIMCKECIVDYIDEVIDEYKNNKKKVLPSWFLPYLEKKGFKQYNKDSVENPILFFSNLSFIIDSLHKTKGFYESGMHEHMTDTPDKALEKLDTSKYIYIFILSGVSQFYISWDMYIKEKD
jgi:hypothetical protein